MEIQLDYMSHVLYCLFVDFYLGILTLGSPRLIAAQKLFFHNKSYPMDTY